MAKIILLTGTSGSGKTTTAQQFLKARKDVWAYINQDDIRELIKTGRESADGMYETWNNNTKTQWAVSIPICVDLAIRYKEFGINCLVDFYSTLEEFEVWKKHLGKVDYSLLVLMPDKQTVLYRNNLRKYPAKLSDNKVLQAYEEFQNWHNSEIALIIDNTTNTITDTVKLLSDTVIG